MFRDDVGERCFFSLSTRVQPAQRGSMRQLEGSHEEDGEHRSDGV